MTISEVENLVRLSLQKVIKYIMYLDFEIRMYRHGMRLNMYSIPEPHRSKEVRVHLDMYMYISRWYTWCMYIHVSRSTKCEGALYLGCMWTSWGSRPPSPGSSPRGAWYSSLLAFLNYSWSLLCMLTVATRLSIKSTLLEGFGSIAISIGENAGFY
jgi:hypothetical protein